MMSHIRHNDFATRLQKPVAREQALAELVTIVQDALVSQQSFVRQSFVHPEGVTLKADDDTVVTATDQRVEESLRETLDQVVDNTYFLAEESSAMTPSDCEEIFKYSYAWLGDPIDGTSNFTRGIPVFGMSMALYENVASKLHPLLGVVLDPNAGELFYTDGLHCCLRDIHSGREETISPLAEKRSALQPLIRIGDLVAKRYSFSIDNAPVAAQLASSTVIDLAYVAVGRATAAVTVSHIWDFAAGLAIGRAAGLHMYNLDTGEIRESFVADDFILDDSANRWMAKETLVLCSPEDLQMVQGMFKKRL